MVPIRILENHYRKFIGDIFGTVWHSTNKKPVHIDVYQVPPNQKRKFWTLITLGMCYQIQKVPSNMNISGRTEILMYTKEIKQWMIKILKLVGETPFENNSYFHWYHTIDFQKPVTSHESKLTAGILLPPFFEDPRFDTLKIKKEKIDFLWFFPITNPELKFAKKKGGRALNNLFSKKRMNPIVDEGRASVI